MKINPFSSPLLADLYQFTMLQSYLEQGMQETAVFELFIRKLPPGRNFMVAAGLEQVLDFLENLQFSAAELSWLATRFRPPLIDYLERFHFRGCSMPCRKARYFPNEPILRITAPLPQAQLIESRIINILHFETLIASKAARSVLVAPGKLLVDLACAELMALKQHCWPPGRPLAGFRGARLCWRERLRHPLYGTMARLYSGPCR